MSIDVEKLIGGLEDATGPRRHPVDVVLDDLTGESDAYRELLWALRSPDSVSAPALSNALLGAGADIKPSQVNSWRRREGISMGKGTA